MRHFVPHTFFSFFFTILKSETKYDVKVFDGACCNDKVDVNKTILLLQAVFAIVSNTLHEEIARLAQLSKPSVSSSMQPVVLSPRSQCSKVVSALTGMVADMASIGMAWYRQFCTIFNTVQENVKVSVIGAIMTDAEVIKIAGKLETKYKTVK